MIDSYFVKKESKCAKHKLDEEETVEEPKMKLKTPDNLTNTNIPSCPELSFLEKDRGMDLQWKHITSVNLNLDYVQLFSKTEADTLFREAEKVIEYNADSQVFVHGKWHKVPRKQAAYGDPGLTYTFSGATVAAKPWSNAPFLKCIADLISSLSGGQRFNFVLVNRYKDGNDHIGEHRDDEEDLVPRSPIASLSLGQARDFVFRHKDSRGSGAKSKIDPVKFELSHGSLLMMNHPTNVYWFHSLPVRKKAICPRINFTFRQMVVKK